MLMIATPYVILIWLLFSRLKLVRRNRVRRQCRRHRVAHVNLGLDQLVCGVPMTRCEGAHRIRGVRPIFQVNPQ